MGALALIGLIPIIALASAIFNFGFWTGFFIWLFFLIIMVVAEAAEEEKKNQKKCVACAEPILKEATKCKHCGQMQ